MADLGPVVGAVGDLAAPLLGRALKAFLATWLGMFALGLAVAVGSVWVAWGHGPRAVSLAGLGGCLLFGLAGFALAGQRAVGAALLEGLRRAQLGTRTVRAIFDALADTRGAEVLARLPLAAAEERLRAVVQSIITSPARGGGLRASLGRRIRNTLVEKVEALTVARFRAEGAGEGGIDVQKIGAELAGKADAALEDQVRGLMFRVTLMVVLGAALVQAGWVWFLVARVT